MMRGSGSTTQTVQVASDVDRSGAVLVLGGTLILVNFAFGPGSPVVGYLSGQIGSPPAKGSVPWGSYGMAVIGVLLLLLLAKTGETGGNFAVLILAAAWIVWLLNSQPAVARLLGQAPSSSNTSSSSSPKSKGSKTK